MSEQSVATIDIQEAMKHFEKNGGQSYETDDDKSNKSKEISNDLKATFENLLTAYDDIALYTKGSKWSVQGQKKLTNGIWYRAYYKAFGKDYPVVLGMHIGADGLNIAIQIYNPALGKIPELSKKLGEIIKDKIYNEKVKEQDKQLDFKERENKQEEYKDFGFFYICKEEQEEQCEENEIEDKFEKVANAYKNIVYKVNETLLDKAIEKFKEFQESDTNQPSIEHIKIKQNGNNEIIQKEIIRHIEKTTTLFKEKNSLEEKINFILNEKFSDNINNVTSFFYLLHEITLDDVKKAAQKDYEELYQYAYLFANLLGKADKKGVQKEEFVKTLKKGKNIIFYGPPGTGKTYAVKQNIVNIVDDDEKQVAITQFHPSYGYEDFIEGIKPTGIDASGNMTFALKDGEFKSFCQSAQEDEEKFLQEEDFEEAISKYGYFFFVDEVNRAELSRVFGELLYALEYRGTQGKIKTQYASLREDDGYFYIPENLFFIGTMNDVDRSIDSFDLALRRRFVWVKKECDYGVIESYTDSSYKEACVNLNKYITEMCGMGDKYQIGHAYFLKIERYMENGNIDKAKDVLFAYHIEPLLQEYLRTMYDENEIKKHIEEAKTKFIPNNNDNNS